MLYSFDVFDTLLIRQTATPGGVFQLMEDKILEIYPDVACKLCGGFTELRTRAEKSAGMMLNPHISESTTIEGIYYCLKSMTALSDEDIDKLIELELETEYENIHGNNKNIQKLKKVLVEGHRVVLISDMYLHSHQIRKLLQKVDAVFSDVPLFVSSDCGVVKATGNLYRYVRRSLVVRYSEWIHFGDNPYLDFSVPLRLGIKAQQYKGTSLLSSEEFILKENNSVYYQRFVGCARLVRNDYIDSVASKLGTTYGAAIVMQYALWVLELCHAKGIKDIFFVARDGYIIFEAAKMLNKIKKYEVNLKYIYGSREAWKIVSIGDADNYNVKEYLESVINKGGCSVGELANSLGISTDQFRKCVSIIEDVDPFEKIAWESDTKFNILEEINANELLRKTLLKQHKEACNRTELYLKQELEDSKSKVAFVDVFGTGRNQDIIAGFIKNKFGIEVVSLFYSRLMSFPTNNKFYSCISVDPERATIVEALTRALHGRTVDYKISDRVYPILKDDDTKELKEYGYDEYIEATLSTIKRFIDSGMNIESKSTYAIGTAYFEYLSDCENGEILRYIQEQPISNCFYGRKTITEFAPRITEEMIEENRRNGFMSIDSSCFFLSLKRCSEDERKKLYESTRQFFEKQNIDAKANAKKLLERPHEYSLDTNAILGSIALYGAGDVGTSIYEKLIKQKDINLVGWFDKKFEKKDGIKDSIENINNYEFDKLIIAIRDSEIATDVMCDLIDKGISPNKFYYPKYELIML